MVIHKDAVSVKSDISVLINTDSVQSTKGLGSEEPIQPESSDIESQNEQTTWSTKKTFIIWLLICYSTGPVSAMTRAYVPAAIQSLAHALGHQPGSERPCTRHGPCVVRFGAHEIDYNSYVLYIKAIATSAEGIIAIFVSGFADYLNYKKICLIAAVTLFGIAALPYAGLTDKTYPVLIGMSALYGLLTAIGPVYEIMEGAYIPIFMRSKSHGQKKAETEDEVKKQMLSRGSKISVWGIVIGNIGGITALLIGLIISYTRGTAIVNGYHDFLLGITIAGCITVTAGFLSIWIFPATKGKPVPPGTQSLLLHSFKRFFILIKEIQKYPEAFKLCVGWVIWNVSYSNFLSVFALLFRTELGLGSSDKEYTVYSFVTPLASSLGSLAWMYFFGRLSLKMKTWSYIFHFVSVFTIFWGCLGINSHVSIGFKNRPEFWVFEVFYMSTCSAQRSLSRTLYSALLPPGREAQFFGLEIMLGVATGWIGGLVNASIQNRTGNLRFPMIPNAILAAVAVCIYAWVDVEKGMRDAIAHENNEVDEEVNENH